MMAELASEVVVDCVSIFYEEGKGGENYRKKNKFRTILSGNEKSVHKLKDIVCEFAGLRETAKKIGLGESLEIQLNRESKSSGRSERIAIETDRQLALELPSILSGTDKLLVIIHPIKLSFSRNVPQIIIQVEGVGDEESTNTKQQLGPGPSTPFKGEDKKCILSSDEQITINKQLESLEGSKIVKCSTHATIKVRGKIISWPWKVQCGLCKKNSILRFDADLKGRVSNFNRQHFAKCKSSNEIEQKDEPVKQTTLEELFAKKRRKFDGAEKKQVAKKTKPSEPAVQIDSDIDESDCEKSESGSDTDVVLSSPLSDSSPDMSVSDNEEWGEEMCSCCSEQSENKESGDESFSTVFVGVEQADLVCVKMNELIRRGKIQRDKIFYKYLKDVVEIMFDPFHKYDREVIEFFNTITYLGGRRTSCFIRGPMNLGDGKNSHRLKEKRMNLGGPSESVCAKYQAGYTPDSGILKSLSLAFYELSSDATPIFKSEKLEVIPCAYASDGTALKPAIEFDSRLKENVGSARKVDLAYVKQNPIPSPNELKENIITEAIVSSLTTLDNKNTLPCAVEYSTLKGKTGDAMSNSFQNHIKTLQICQQCQIQTRHQRNILKPDVAKCESFCRQCFEQEEVCEDCKSIGHTNHIPSLRRCMPCIKNEVTCKRIVILVLTSDCEEGNKKAFENLKAEIESKKVDPYLSLLSILPDCPHVGKSMKASFSNWWLKCENERANLGLLRTLRNRSDAKTKEIFRKLIPKNDFVKNKDRQDPTAVLALSSDKLIKALEEVEYVGHTIIPELDKYSTDNRTGMYPSPISVDMASYGWMVFLSYDTKSGASTLYKARLHSPVDNITIIRKGLDANEVHYSGGILFLASRNGPLLAVEFEQHSISIKLKGKKKKDLQNISSEFGLATTGTMDQLKCRIEKYLDRLSLDYTQRNFKKDEICFWDRSEQPKFECVVCVDNKLIYAANPSDSVITSMQIQKDGIGLRCVHEESISSYYEGWNHVYSLCIKAESLFVSSDEGISQISLQTGSCVLVVPLHQQPCTLAKLGTDLLFTNESNASVWRLKDNGALKLFAGGDEGNQDGLATTCRFQQPLGICTEFDNVVYVCDAQTNSIKLFTSMKKCAKFLRSIGSLYDAFSVHSKGTSYTVKSLDEAVALIGICRETLEQNDADIRSATNISGALNGPQGNISAKTVGSVNLMEWGIRRLREILLTYNYTSCNLLSCMTLDIEHCHATVHTKQPNMSMLEYCRSFGATIKESVKRITQWAAYYHTSRKSWYPTPESALHFFDVPVIEPLPPTSMSPEDSELLRNWATSYGAAVRQRTVRQETTMAKHGALPEYMYQRECVATEKVRLRHDLRTADTEVESEGDVDDTAETDEIDGFDESSDDDNVNELSGDETESDLASHNEIGNSTNFLIGTRSRFGRAIRLNNRLLF